MAALRCMQRGTNGRECEALNIFMAEALRNQPDRPSTTSSVGVGWSGVRTVLKPAWQTGREVRADRLSDVRTADRVA